MHVRPEVDRCLQLLPQLLNPGGFLVVHDCNPEDVELTSKVRRPDKWLGETYKAFALFHAANLTRSITVHEDYGVGIILNERLELDYNIQADIEYNSVAADRILHLGLIEWPMFLDRLARQNRSALVDGRKDVLGGAHAT